MNITYSSDAKYWLALTQCITDTTLFALLKYFKDPETILNTPKNILAEKSGISLKRLTVDPDYAWAEKQLTQLQNQNVHLITWFDQNYPKSLREITRPPALLFVKGNVQALAFNQLAMVGSRKPSLGGIEAAHALAFELTEAGLTITSGLALGIDRAAHEGALKASSPTIAVLGSGLDIIYPHTHLGLAKQIIEQQGALVSEFPLGTPPKAAHFPQRNRIISGLSLGTLVIEATLKSGSLITARYALDHNREVFATPGSIHNPLAIGCNKLIKEGAKLVETKEDVLEELGMLKSNIQPTHSLQGVDKSKAIAHHLDQEDQKVLSCLTFDTATPIDRIIEYTGLGADIVTTRLLTMELDSYVASIPGGYIRKKRE